MPKKRQRPGSLGNIDERHYMGEVQAIEFESYEQIESRFESEFRALYDSGCDRGR